VESQTFIAQALQANNPKQIISSLNQYNVGAKKNEKMRQRIAAQNQTGLNAI
jgi:hypothetical protein